MNLLFGWFGCFNCRKNRLHGGTVGSAVALQQEGSRFNSRPGVFLHGVCMFSPHAWDLSVAPLLPCDGLAACPGCTLPLSHRLLEISTSILLSLLLVSGFAGSIFTPRPM
ncbi:hypothetical protein CRENBAI_013905 [Crenichthys baileyi]|uniref:Uncharacterized protein n=1 Tax=Crenichthys baileyi TaxID=28760 RepID=A0AAV9SDW3_9TELE